MKTKSIQDLISELQTMIEDVEEGHDQIDTFMQEYPDLSDGVLSSEYSLSQRIESILHKRRGNEKS